MFEVPFVVPRLLEFAQNRKETYNIVSYGLLSTLCASLRFADKSLLESLINPVTAACGGAFFPTLAASMSGYARRQFGHGI